MPITQTEIDDTVELFSMLGPIRVRKMMGGLAIYAHDVTFAMYDPEQGYFLKSDALTHREYEAEGMRKFEFETKDGKTLTMNYYGMDDAFYDDAELRETWARKALDVALRAAALKASKKRKTKKKKLS